MLRGSFEPFLVLLGVLMALLVIVRPVVALLEDRRVNARLRRTVLQMSEVQQDLNDALGREIHLSDRLRAELEAHENPS